MILKAKALQLLTWLAISLMIISVIGFQQVSELEPDELEIILKGKYDQLIPLDGSKPSFDLYERGMIGYINMKADGKKIDNKKITLIDFRLSSKVKRMWIIDLKDNKVLNHRLVSHGKNTGEEYAKNFSNIKNSNQSSLGFYITGENYIGKHGLSMRLDGQESGFNDKARIRAIVMHSANYVSKDFAKSYGRLGRSFGCPAIANDGHKEIIKKLANKSVLFIYAGIKEYDEKTKLNDREKALKYIKNNETVVTATVSH